MLVDLVLLGAMLTWNATPTELFVFYPSGGGIEEVCIGEIACFVPSSQIGEVVPWTQPIPYVRVRQHGSHRYAWPLPETVS
jgi:hypothetical protein